MNTALISFLSYIMLSISPSNSYGGFTAYNSKYIIKSDTNIVLNVPFVHQIDNLPESQKASIRNTACGPATINMLLNYYGGDEDLFEVIEKLPTTVYVRGDRFYNLYEAPKYFSKRSIEIGSDTQSLYETLKKGDPIILNVQNYDGITGHALVVVGVLGYDVKSNTAESLVVHDPYRAPYRIFDYINQNTLKQPEGYNLSIGILDPFYIENNLLSNAKMNL